MLTIINHIKNVQFFLKKCIVYQIFIINKKSNHQFRNLMLLGLIVGLIIILTSCMHFNEKPKTNEVLIKKENKATNNPNSSETQASSKKEVTQDLEARQKDKNLSESQDDSKEKYSMQLETDFNLFSPPKKSLEIPHAVAQKSESKKVHTFDSTKKTILTKPEDTKQVKKESTIKVKRKSAVTINKQPDLLSFTPFSKHKERYHSIFKLLKENGNISSEKIIKIFSSKRAKKKDMAPIKRMSKKVITNTRLRSTKQTRQIARKIKKHLKKYKTYYNELEDKYKVNKEIAAALFYKETVLGEFNNWQHESFTVLNTIVGYMELPDKTEPRQRKRIQRVIESSQQSLAELIIYCDQYNIDILKQKFPSSFAGAIGIPQFLPMYLKYAISANNTRPDISNLHDAILSLGNILTTKFDWPGYLDIKQLNNIDEIRRLYKSFDDQYNDASLCMSKDLDDYELLSFYDNHSDIPNIDYVCKYSKCLMKYNFSSSYSLDILQFAFYASNKR